MVSKLRPASLSTLVSSFEEFARLLLNREYAYNAKLAEGYVGVSTIIKAQTIFFNEHKHFPSRGTTGSIFQEGEPTSI